MKNDFLAPLRMVSTGLFTLASLFANAAETPKVQLKPAWTTNLVLQRPLWMSEAPDGSKRLFVVEQAGRILILPSDRTSTNTVVFLDITERRPYRGNEEGLLGFAFHPQFKANGKTYVYYSQQNPRRSVVSEFTAAKGDANKLDPASERVVMELAQPFENHNGGEILFGPDGMLYVGLGDGGAARDPFKNGQNLNSLLGKILRIDVNGRDEGLQYALPKDNPFFGKEGVRGEIWALGLRNPWRISFDRQTGELYAGDVGQDKWEEVSIITKGGNYGWNTKEAFHDFTNTVVAAGTKLTPPILEYPHNPSYDTNNPVGPGLSITGGYVYRGKKVPSLQGWYVFGDFNFGTIWALRHENGRVTAHAKLSPPLLTRNISSFGEDGAGELYVLTYEPPKQTLGRIYEFEEVK